MTTGDATLVIVAAGRSERYGGTCKVMELVHGQPVLAWSMQAADLAPSICDVIVVVGAHSRDEITRFLESGTWDKPWQVVEGGARRQDSVAAGVLAVPESSTVVLVHDGARPLAPVSLYESCAEAARQHGACIAATPVSDTLKSVSDGTIQRTVSRNGLWAAQTPQGFLRHILQPAVARAGESTNEFTDEASMLEAAGIPVHIVPGSRSNLKVTVPEDLAMVDALMSLRHHSPQGTTS